MDDSTDTTTAIASTASSKWNDAATYTGIASTVAGILGTFGIVNADQTSLIVAAVAGFAGGVIAVVRLVRTFRKG